MTDVTLRQAHKGMPGVRATATQSTATDSGGWHPVWLYLDGSRRIIEWSEYPTYAEAQKRAEELLKAVFAQGRGIPATENDPADSLEPSVTGLADPADAVESVREADYFPDDLDAAQREEDERLRAVFRDVDYSEIENRALAKMLLPDDIEDEIDAPLDMTETERLAYWGLRAAAQLAHKTATDAGWYRDPANGEPVKRNFGEVVALMHSELSEALEADRKGLMDDKLTDRDGREVEFADCILRIFDTSEAEGLDVAGAYIEKNRYNRQRADHKLENRAAVGGKAY